VLVQETRTITYSYDGLNRLIGAAEQPGTTYGYTYDLVGNRTEVRVDGSVTDSHTYNAANQVVGWTYDAAGNLTNDGTTTYVYDALNRLTTQGSTTNTYTGDGTLVAQTTGDTTTCFTQDLAAPLSQVLQRTQGSTTTEYVYGHDRVLALDGTVQTWYGSDVLGSVRQTFDSGGTPSDVLHYDPWGTPQTSTTLPQAKLADGFTLKDVCIDLTERTAICPPGHAGTPKRFRGHGDMGDHRIVVTFKQHNCLPCPLRSRCITGNA
jgi:YD repeat-containing protein